MERFPHSFSRQDRQGSVGVFTPSLCHASLQEIRSWVHEVEELGMPHFGEFADRLEHVRDLILGGSGNPPDKGSICLCEDLKSPGKSQSSGMSGQDNEDRSLILGRLDSMITTLRSEESCFMTWQSASRSFEKLCQLMAFPDQLSHELP